MDNKEQLQKELDSLYAQAERVKEAMKDKPKFEKGKWYQGKRYPDLIACYNQQNNNYGFDYRGGWRDNMCMAEYDYWNEASESVVFKALEKEAVKRGYKEGVKVEPIKDFYYGGGLKYNSIVGDFYYETNILYYKVEGFCFAIYCEGVWATIIKDEPIYVNGYEVLIYDEYVSVNINGSKTHFTKNDGNAFRNLLKIGITVETLDKILARLENK